MVTKSLKHAVVAKESSQPKSTYEAVSSLKNFELKKILIDKIDENKDKDEDPSAGSDRGLKKRKTSKDAKPTKGPKAKESQFGSSKGAKSQSKSSGKSVQSEEAEFEVADSYMPQDQEENPGNDDKEPKGKVASKHDWFTKPKRSQEPTNPDWNKGKTQQQGPTQIWLMTLASYADKLLKTFDELMSSPIDFSAYIMNGIKITNLTKETLLGAAFKLLKGTRSNYDELEYDFKEYYKALSKKLDWNNLEGGDYPFDLTKPLPLVMNGNHQIGISHWRQQRKTFYGYARGLESSHDVYSTKRILAVTRVEVMMKHGYGYLREIEVQRVDNDLYTFKEGDFLRLRINDIEDLLILIVQNRLTNFSGDGVSDFAIALRMFTRSMVIQKRVEDL
ncbi:hypothetical protein Tco_1296454 [Tanacetum coccineum]